MSKYYSLDWDVDFEDYKRSAYITEHDTEEGSREPNFDYFGHFRTYEEAQKEVVKFYQEIADDYQEDADEIRNYSTYEEYDKRFD